MKISNLKILNYPIVKEFSKILFFGVLSLFFGLITVQVPGLEGTHSDLREIPLLISLFYISNPVSLILISALTALGAISIGSFWPTLLAHAFSLLISLYFFKYIEKQKIHYSISGTILVAYIIIYYTVFLLPLLIIFNYFFGLNLEINFFKSFESFLSSSRFEILSTAIITSLYFVQYRVQKELKQHKKLLKIKVKERTEELETSNEELKSLNDELFEKSEIITNQNSELTTTLQHLKETQSHLVQAEKMASLGTLTAGVAHELNNPLNFIMGGLGGLEDYYQKENQPKEIQLMLNSIKTGAERATNIIKGLNQFSRTNDNYNEDCDIHSILNNCLLILQNQLKSKIEINTKLCNESVSVIGNTGMLLQVFINILTNSIQAINKQGTILITTLKKEPNFIIQIKDTGCGIKKKHISKITDPFFTTKDPGKGTGLGLSISYSIIQEHKGNLEFQSELGKGTTVIITLPLKSKK